MLDALVVGAADTGIDLNNLALLYKTQGRYAKAEPLYKRALAIHEKALGPDHPDVGKYLNNLALLYKTQGRYAKAEPLYRRALAIHEKALGPDHSDVGKDLNNIAGLYRAEGRYAEAEPLNKRALAIHERALGPDNPSVGTILNNLGELYRTQGRYAEAEPLHKRALTIDEKALGPRPSRCRHRPQQSYDIKFDGATFVFSWPSRERLWGYWSDSETVRIAATHLMDFLQKIDPETKVKKIHFVAHSMGDRGRGGCVPR